MKTIITGGHFTFHNGKPFINKGTIESFRLAVSFAQQKRLQGSDVAVGILINDIGIVCGEGLCLPQNTFSIDRASFSLPYEYLTILREYNMRQEDIIIFWEKYIRNRSKKFFRKKVKEGFPFLRRDESYYYKLSHNKEIPISRKRPYDHYGSPACPLIMSFFLKEQERLGFGESINIYYVGDDNYINIPKPKALHCGLLLENLVDQKNHAKNILMVTPPEASLHF